MSERGWMEYGSEFDWKSNDALFSDTPQGFVQDDWQLYRSGRDAMKAAARIIGGRRVLLPALCCESMILPFAANGYDVDFYRLNPDLTGDEAYVREKLTDGTVLLYMRYFGIRPFTDEFLRSLRESVRGITLIEDRTHDVIVPRGEERFAPDAVLASLRKWAALPEGGMLRTGMGSCAADADARFGDTRREVMETKVRYLETWEPELKKEFLNKLHSAERLLDESGKPCGMSAEYEALLRCIDFTALLARRRANVARLKERLAALGGTRLRFLSRHPEESTLYFPVYLENRGEIQRAMAQRGVYCPVIWPEPEAARGACAVSRYVTEHMLALPCDQRYTPEDMDFIADTLIEALEKTHEN